MRLLAEIGVLGDLETAAMIFDTRDHGECNDAGTAQCQAPLRVRSEGLEGRCLLLGLGGNRTLCLAGYSGLLRLTQWIMLTI